RTPLSVLPAELAMIRSLAVVLAAAAAPLAAAAEREPIRLVSDFALSPDGRQIAFAWAGDVWTAALEDGLARPLTRDPADDREPRFSPDGREIAFTSNRDGEHQVYVMSAHGGPAERITHHSERHQLV